MFRECQPLFLEYILHPIIWKNFMPEAAAVPVVGQCVMLGQLPSLIVQYFSCFDMKGNNFLLPNSQKIYEQKRDIRCRNIFQLLFDLSSMFVTFNQVFLLIRLSHLSRNVLPQKSYLHFCLPAQTSSPSSRLSYGSSSLDQNTSNMTLFKLNTPSFPSLFSSVCHPNEFINPYSSYKWNREAEERTREITITHPVVKIHFNSQQRNEACSPLAHEVLDSANSPENELRSQLSSSEPSDSLIISIFDVL